MTGRATILRADARSLPLPDASVDLVVTSPPYFALRSYQDGGEHYGEQIGAEPTPREYIAALIDCTREWMRVLKPGGSIWVNLGDKYSQRVALRRSSHQDGLFPDREDLAKDWKRDRAAGLARMPYENVTDVGSGRYVPEKSLMLLPERYRVAAVDELGLIARAVVIWCLSGGARLYARTPSGDRPVMLRDLVRSYRPEDVQLWNGERWTQVRGWNRTPDDEGALEFELRTGERIGCTTTHQWPTDRGLLRADEIRTGDVIETTRLPEPDQPRRPSALDEEDIGWLIGLYVAEGSRSEKMLQFAGHVREGVRHARLRRIAEAYDGRCAVYQTSENGVTCNLSGSVLVGIIDRYVGRGRTARSKRLRHAAWQRSDRFLAAVVDGYLSGDGHHDVKNDRWRLGFSANDEWAADLRTLAARLGAKLSLRRHDHMFDGRKYPGWRGEWRWTRSTHHNAKRDGEVVAIRRSRARDFYDLGVADEPHLFALASGVLTHNSKPNGLPESVTDRVRRSHEDWVHLTKQPRYYSAVDEIREPHIYALPQRRNGRGGRPNDAAGRPAADGSQHLDGNPLGKLPGSVWTIATEPLKVPAELGIDHFAAFPTEWPRRIILGWSPSGICVECGEGRRPVSDKRPTSTQHSSESRSSMSRGTADLRGVNRKDLEVIVRTYDVTITGEACACSEPTAPTRPSVVLDPFGGTGTTALVAKALGRHGVSGDRSADYCRLGRWRTTDPGQLAKALRVVAPAKELDGQASLLDLFGSEMAS